MPTCSLGCHTSTSRSNLGEAIEAAFGSVQQLERELSAAGAARFGSGWAWLIRDGTGLAVISTQRAPYREPCP